MKKSIIFILVLVPFLISSGLLTAQNDSTSVTFYKPSEIPVQIENATSFLVQQKREVLSRSMVTTAQNLLERFENKFEKLNSLSDSASIKSYNSVQLRNYNHDWETLQSELGESLILISKRTEELEKEKERLNTLLLTWKSTRKEYNKGQIPSELLVSINDLEDEINTSLEILNRESNNLLTIQTGFSNKNIKIETMLITLRDLISSKKREAFEKNSDPMWKIFSDSTESEVYSSETSQLVSTYKVTLNNFYDFYAEKIPLGVMIFLIFLAFTLILKYYSKKIEDPTETIQRATSLLKRPIAVSLLLFLLFLSVISETSSSFEGLLNILILFPILLILLRIVDPRLKSGLFVFLALFLLKELKVNTGSDTLFERYLLLLLTLLSYFGIYWAMKNRLFTSLIENEKILSIVRIIYKISLTIVTLVLLLNILGYVQLANVLINGFYNSIFATVLLLTANFVFNSLLLLLLKSKPMQKLQIVSLHPDSIIATSKKIISVIITFAWFVIVLDSFLIYDILFTAFDEIITTNIGFGSISLSLKEIFYFIATIWVSLQITKFLQFILEIDILPQFKLPRGVPGAIISLTKYIIITIGLFLALMSVGIDFNKFAILIGALGVGIGFGLQNLVNNFISGIVLIFERPIQTGDVIKVGEITGIVKKIGIRASVVRTFDGAEIIVPNGNLISAELTNWTFSDRFRRMDVVVGVKYGSDVEKVKELLLLVANDVEGVIDRPPPIVLFNNFGNSSLDFILRSWTKDFDNWMVIESNIRFEINRRFEENGIVIPFPQSDINFKNKLSIENSDGEEN